MHRTRIWLLLSAVALMVSAAVPSAAFATGLVVKKKTPQSLIRETAYSVLGWDRHIAEKIDAGLSHTDRALFKGTVAFLLNPTTKPNKNLINMHIAGGGVGQGGDFISATYPFDVTTSYGEMSYLRDQSNVSDVFDGSWLMRTETPQEEIVTLRPMMPLGHILDETITARRPLGDTGPFAGRAIGGSTIGEVKAMEVNVHLVTQDDSQLSVTVAGKTPKTEATRTYTVWERSLAERHDIESGGYLAVGGNLGISGRRLATQLNLPVTPKAFDVGQIVGVALDDTNLFVGIDPTWALLALGSSTASNVTGKSKDR